MRADAVLAAVDLLVLKKAALLFFFGVFIAVVIHLIRGGRERFQRAASIPLDDQSVVDPRSTQESDYHG